MAARPLLFYLPIAPVVLMIFMIVGVAVWVHNTKVFLNQIEYSLAVLGPSVTAPNFHRVEEAVPATSSCYMIFASALYGLALYRKVLSLDTDLSGPKVKVLKVYHIVNGVIHFIWWLIMIWLVVLLMGLSAAAILAWVGYNAAQQVLQIQTTVAPYYADRLASANNATAAALTAAGGDVLRATLISNGWPPEASCPPSCANLLVFAFIEVDASGSCVCGREVIQTVAQATRTALNAVPGIFVGIWFMYVFGDFFKTSLAIDLTNAWRDGEVQGSRGSASLTRGYNKL